MLVSSESLRAEESRIQQAYARRQSGHLYSRFNPAHLLMVHEREKRLLGLLCRHGCESLESKKILEVGCGTGDLLRDLVKWGARPENIVGIDLLPERVAEAIQLCPKAMEIHRGNAAVLEFETESFDVVIQSTVFTSVLDLDVKRQMASEMCRVLKWDGLILWYDYHMDNPRNPDVRGIKYQEIHALFPKCEIYLQRITLAPPIARLLAPHCWLFCCLLSKIPLLCTHYLGVIRKSSETPTAPSPEGKRTHHGGALRRRSGQTPDAE
jgi:ubiquinone/menaquinone biosynthesis C-methylase UbiE